MSNNFLSEKINKYFCIEDQIDYKWLSQSLAETLSDVFNLMLDSSEDTSKSSKSNQENKTIIQLKNIQNNINELRKRIKKD